MSSFRTHACTGSQVRPLIRVTRRALFAAASGLLATLLLVSGQAFAAMGASVSAGGNPTDVYPGQLTAIQITLSNNNAAHTVDNVTFNTSLPGTATNGLVIAGAATYTCHDPAGAGSTIAGSGTLTAAVGTQTIALSAGVIPARDTPSATDGSCTILVPVMAKTTTGSSATYTYTILGGAVTGNDGTAVANSGDVNQSINVTAMSKPGIAKSFGSTTIYLGGAPTTLTITVTNNAAAAIANFRLTDNLPANIQVAAVPNATANCSGAGVAPTFTSGTTQGDTAITVTGGTLAASGTCTISVSVEGKSTNGGYSWAQTNTIATTDFTDDIGIPSAANATRSITVNSPLAVSKTVLGGGLLSDGQSDSFRIRLTNNGTAALVINSLTDDPIDGTTAGNLNAYGLKVDPAGATVSCTAGGTAGTFSTTANSTGIALASNTTIAAGGYCDVTIPFTAHVQTAGTPDTRTNTLAVGAVGTTTAGIVSQSASAAVIVADDLRVTKGISPASGTGVVAGSAIKYAIAVQNFGAGAISGVTISDPLTNGQTFLTGTINGANYTPTLSGTGCSNLVVGGTATTPTFTIDMPGRSGIATPGSCSVTFYAMTATGGTVPSNFVPANSICYNNGTPHCNGSASNTVTGTVQANVATVTKTYDKTSPQPEGTIVRATITINNWSANPLAIGVSDNLPLAASGGQMRVASPANAATTCGGSPVITAAAGSTSVAMSGATVPARGGNGTSSTPGSCTLQIDVVAGAGIYTVAAGHPNTATVSYTETYMDASTHTGSASASADFTFSSALCGNSNPCTKSFSPAAVSSGGKSTVTVHLTNTGALALTGVAATDPLPAGMVVAPTPNAYTTCSGSTAITATAGAGSASLTGAAIAGNGSCDFVFDVVASGGANWTNTIPAGNITASGGVANQSPVAATLTYQAPNNPSVSKQTNPSTLTFPGQVSQLKITLTSGTQALTGLHFTDYFTANGTSGAAANGMVIAPTPAASTTCTGGIVTAVPGAGSVSVSGVSMTASSSCDVFVNVTSTAVGGLTNYIPPGSIVSDQGLSNAGQATTSLTTQSNVGIAKQFTPNVIKPGARSRLRITFFNPTAQPATGLAVTDNLPAGVVVATGPNPTTTCGGATVTAVAGAASVSVSGGTLAGASGGVAASCYAEMDLTAAAQGDYTNTIPASAVAATIGGISVTNSQPTSDVLRVKSPLEVQKAIDSKTLDTVAQTGAGFTLNTAASTPPGTAKTLTIRLRNPNAAALTSAAFTDALPSGLVVANTPNASTTCTGGAVFAAAAGTSVRLSGATIPANGACSVTVDVLSNISGSYTNSIAAGAVTTYEGTTNEDPTSAKIVVSTPPTVGKQFAPAVVPQNGTSTLTIVLGNGNSSAATLSSPFVDTLPTAPGAIVVAPTPNVGKTCPGAVTAAAGSGTVTYASGATIPAGGCTISVDVVATATAGVHTNNIPAGALVTDLGSNQSPANATLTVSALGYISGRVFQDNDTVPDGIYTSGTDTPLANVIVSLFNGVSCGGGAAASTTTDALGNYQFSGLAAGTYSVCETEPGGTLQNGITTGGSIVGSGGGTAGAATGIATTPSRITGIVLGTNAGQVDGSIDNNFAEVAPSSIAGTVFLDQNNNGVQNGADTGIAGVIVNLTGYSYGPNGADNAGGGDDVAVSLSTTTDVSGNYSFTGLAPGKYIVTEPTQPAGTANGITTAGSSGGSATAVAVAPSRISAIVLPPNTAATAYNFAEIPGGRTISGTVFLDYNNNGALNNPPDHGIGGQTLNLTGSDINSNAVSASTTTASDGTFSFTGLPAGTYTVTQPTQPTGTTNGITTAGSSGGAATAVGVTPSVISAIDLTGANTVSANNNFAEVPGAAPDLTIAKTHNPSSFAAGGATGFYTITPGNIGTVTTSGTLTIVDTLPAGITPTAASGAGWTCGIAGQVVTCTSAAAIAGSGTGNVIILRVSVGASLAGQVLTNTAVISGGGEPAGFDGNNTAADPTPIAAGAALSGHVWRDANHDRVMDAGEAKVAGWPVELLLSGVVIATTTTDAAGAYAFTGLAPAAGYQVRFHEPLSGTLYGSAAPNESGTAFTNGTASAANPAGADNSDGTLKGLTLVAGANVTEQSLPLDPSGVVYDSVTRQPVAGATVSLSGPAGFTAADVVSGSLTQTTGANGFYQFLLFNTAPAGSYTLTVTAPAGYLPAPSTLIPACTGTLAVGAAPNPALVQNTSTPPAANVPNATPTACPGIVAGGSATTQYYFSFNLDPATSANLINNHIPLDPILGGAIIMTKTTPLINVVKGDLVPYTLTATNTLSAALTNVNVQDQIPAGFRYRSGSATLNGSGAEPTVSGRTLTWPNLTFAGGEKKTWKLILVVGSGVGEGEYINQTWALNNVVGSRISNVAAAKVRVVPDPNFDCSDIIGKVFDDKNANGYQDEGEPGIANVRAATPRGLLVTSDADGRFHVACADVPQADHGSNFVMKLDERSLPSGYRLTTENPRDVRVTRGKMVKLNFGATVHRVVRLDVNAAAFAGTTTDLLPEWGKRLAGLPAQLASRPSVLRIAYSVGGESADLARQRLDAVAAQIKKLWQASDEERKRPPLVVETEMEGAR